MPRVAFKARWRENAVGRRMACAYARAGQALGRGGHNGIPGGTWRVWLVVSIGFGLGLGSCAPGVATSAPVAAPEATAAPSLAPEPSATPDLLPELTLVPGERYFRLEGQPAFIYSRNLAGYKPEDFDLLVMAAHQGGAMLVRVGLDNVAMGGNKGYGYSSDGMINDRWSQRWEHFFTLAEANGVYVIPYFTGWMNWNATGYNTWADNPLNAANGGPAASPTEIFKRNSGTQQLYFKWFRSVVERWQHHRNILAWELVSEVNLIGYISESQGVDLVEQMAAIAREADDLHRPTTASLADMPGWSDFYRSDSVEFINYHPYPISSPTRQPRTGGGSALPRDLQQAAADR